MIALFINRLTPNDPYMGRTTPLTSKGFILYIYSTSIGTEYFKHALHSPFFSLQNAVCFIMLTCLVPVLFTFYIQGVLKLKNNSSAKGLNGVYQTGGNIPKKNSHDQLPKKTEDCLAVQPVRYSLNRLNSSRNLCISY